MAGKSLSERLSAELDRLVSDGKVLLERLRKYADFKDLLEFSAEYHTWYTRALSVVKTLLPERLDEFRRQYERNEKRKGLNRLSYSLEDYLGAQSAPTTWSPEEGEFTPSFNVHGAAFMKLNTQVAIVASCTTRLDEILANVRGVLQADLFDSELDAARDLLKNGHLRGAGAVAGVVLEGHLAEVCNHHAVVIRKKDPHINDFNEALKKAGVFDVTQWRGVQRLADIRNLCDHKKARDPTPEEVEELISGVDKAIKTLT